MFNIKTDSESDTSGELTLTWKYILFFSQRANSFIYLLSCWTRVYPAFANSVDEKANWSGPTLFAIKYANL